MADETWAFADEGLEILSEQQCLELLSTAKVGRLAVCLGAVPAVLPVTFTVIGGDVMFFTGTGLKLNAALRKQSVAFEVDHIDVAAESGWSVLVVGRAVPAGATARARTEALGLYPWAPGQRHHLIRIRPELISGRRILSGQAP